MADKAPENSKKGPFHYTTGEYWEGSAFPYWLHMILTILPTGFFGIDHLLLHSPQTALQKAIVNLFTLGFWYFYDVVQVFTDRSYVDKYGLSRPFLGPTGLGHKSFTGVLPPEKQETPDLPPAESGRFSSIFLALYLALIFVPFGIPNFVVGDTSGGVIKFIFTILLFGLFVPFVFLSAVYELFMTVSNPVDIYEKGVHLTIPFSWIVGSENLAPRIMKPSAFAAATKPQGSIFTRLIQPIFDMLGLSSIAQMLGAAKCAAEPVIEQGQKAVNAAITAGSGVAKLAGTVPEVATKVAGKLEAFTDPEKLKAAAGAAAGVPALPTAPPMVGGGLLGSGELDSWFFLSIGVLLTSAALLSGVRWLRNLQTQKKNDKPPESHERNDTPPQPNAL
jgi:hypothetical protein